MKLDVLAFGAHADDVELACSGTLIKCADLGYTTGIVTLTKGEMGTRGNAEIRQKEFNEAGQIMGISVGKMLDIPDGRVELTWENKLKIIDEIRIHKPRIVLAPYWITRHPDHEKTSHLVRESAYLAGLAKLSTDHEAYRPYRVIFYHCRYEFEPSFIVDISKYHEQKMNSLRAYKSQFHVENIGDSEEKETLLSRPDFFDRIETRDKQYGTYIGVKYGEPFLVREALKLDDPVQFFGPECLNFIP